MSDLSEFRRAKDEFFRRDPQSPLTAAQREGFEGLAYYDEDPGFAHVVAPERYEDPETQEMRMTTGELAWYERWARVRFEVDGELVALTVFRNPEQDSLFIPFVDAGAGQETYGGGRYLEVPQLEDGMLLVDFNYAYNPFCAYNENYGCPIPSEENRLPIAITAGEYAYDGPVEGLHQH